MAALNWADRIAAHKVQNLYRERLIRESAEGPEITVQGEPLLAFCSNDYLGFASDPRLVERASQAMAAYGVGAGASHYITGHCALHEALEQALAEFTGREAALLFPSGYMANVGGLAALLTRSDTVIQDKLNHASLLDGARMSGARLLRFAHNDMDGLAHQLERAKGLAVVAVDGVFSMDGDCAPLPDIVSLCEQHQALLWVDDAHGLGVLGPAGQGTVAHQGLNSAQVPLLMGTLGKALGGYGAFVAGDRELIEYLTQFARTAIYTTATPPLLAASTLAALDILQQEPERLAHLRTLIQVFRQAARERGWSVPDSQTAIQPLLVGEAGRALQISQRLKAQGILVPAIRPPTVPQGQSRLRVTLSANHSLEHVEQLIDVLDASLRETTLRA